MISFKLSQYAYCAPALLALTLSSTGAAAGQYYKWVDENGVSHFSELPPKEAKAEKIKTNTRTPSSEAADDTSSSEKSENFEEKATESTPKIAKDPSRCAAEQGRLKQLASGARIRMKNSDGGFYYLDEQQIQQEMQKSRQAISESCE